MIKSDKWITDKVFEENGLIDPFVPYKETKGVLSYGLESYGYTFRIAGGDVRLFPNYHSGKHIDPKNFDKDIPRSIVIRDGTFFIPPHSFVLAYTVEHFNMPKDVLGICIGKSTYARCGLILNVTPIEPGWSGHITLELSNTSDFAIKVYCNEGIGQILFFRGDEYPKNTYGEGIYQNQEPEVVFPKIRS